MNSATAPGSLKKSWAQPASAAATAEAATTPVA